MGCASSCWHVVAQVEGQGTVWVGDSEPLRTPGTLVAFRSLELLTPTEFLTAINEIILESPSEEAGCFLISRYAARDHPSGKGMTMELTEKGGVVPGGIR